MLHDTEMHAGVRGDFLGSMNYLKIKNTRNEEG